MADSTNHTSFNDLVLLNDIELDPDLNYFNVVDTNECKYTLEEEVHEYCSLNSSGAFSIVHINCRSLNKNFDNLLRLIDSLKVMPTVIAVTETWLNSFNEDHFIIPGYTFFASSRKSKSGGGVGLYITNLVISAVKIVDIIDNYFEFILVEITQPNCKNIIVGAIYRPPSGDLGQFNLAFDNFLNLLISDCHKHIFLAGDYNINLLRSDSHVETDVFVNNLRCHSFVPTIDKPTRVGEYSSTLIDNIFINVHCFNYKSAIIYNDLSDHFPIILSINLNVKLLTLPNKIFMRFFPQREISRFHAALKMTNWNKVCNIAASSNDPNDAYNLFLKLYTNIYDKFFPQKEIKTSNKMHSNQPWLTAGLKRSCSIKSKLYKKYVKSRSLFSENIYKAYRNLLKTILKKAEKDYYTNKVLSAEKNSRQLWKEINRILNNKTKPHAANHFIDENNKNNEITDNLDIANKFNDYFSKIGHTLASKITAPTKTFDSFLSGSFCNSMSFMPTDANEVILINSCLKNKMSHGHDKIALSIMKGSIDIVAPTLACIINTSLSSGIFPDSLKTARVCPVFKSGDRRLFSNYRPISVLSCFSKIFEKIVYKRLTNYLSKNNILTESQYGFRPGHTTSMALLDMYDGLSQSIEDNKFGIGIFVDLSKAFDCIDHGILIKKLHHYGIRGIVLNWFISYLSMRSQFVSFNNTDSALRYITCGVPQGSILGPLLFLIYVNDIANCSSILNLIMFADDTNVFYSNSDLVQLNYIVNIEVKKLLLWFKANKLTINVNKTNFILFCGKGKQFDPKKVNIVLDDIPINQVSSTKFLGVLVDKKLNWKIHINTVCKKISKSIGILRKLSLKLPISALKAIYNSLIEPYIRYCNVVWGSNYSSNLECLYILQKKALRLVCQVDWKAHSSPLFTQLHKLNVFDLNKLLIGSFMFQIHTNSISIAKFNNMFCMNSRNVLPHNICTRGSKNYFLPIVRTNFRKFNIRFRGPSIWNSIPESIRCVNTLHSFKYLYARYLSSIV